MLTALSFILPLGTEELVFDAELPSGEVLAPKMVYDTKPACNDVKCLILELSGKYGVDTETALRIAFAESGFVKDAVNYNTNGTNDVGVYQINSVHNVPDECRFNAECNIEWAMKKMQSVGTSLWNSSKHNWE